MPPEEEKSLREQLSEAYDKEEVDVVQQPEVESASGEDAEGDGSLAPAGEETLPAAESEGAAAEESEGGDTDGAKFLPPEGTEPGDEAGKESVEETLAEPEERVPVGWKGEAKLKWAEVPQEVRQEVVRREKEVNDVLRESAGSRQFQEAFERTIAPFQQFIAADGGDPLTATRNLMQTAAVLRVGSPQQKAQTVAQIVRQFGVDIETLDSALAGAPAQPGNGAGMSPDVQQYLQQQLAPVQQFMGNLQSRVRQANEAQATEVSSEIEAFENNPKYPYFEDVREDMGWLFERANQRNEKLTLESAYEQAIRMNPKLSEITSKQQAARQAQAANKSLEAKKRAAASLRGTSPAPAAPAEPKDLRGALEKAWDKAASA